MLSGWVDLIRRRFVHKHDFVSVDARRSLMEARNYEMIASPPPTAYTAKSPDPLLIHSPKPNHRDDDFPSSPSTKADRSSKTDYFGKEATYACPTLSFSTPRPPSATGRTPFREWDPESTHAKGSMPTSKI